MAGCLSYLQQVLVGKLSHRSPHCHIGRQVEDCIAVVVLTNLHKVSCTSVCEEVDPIFWIERISREILDEVVVHMIWSVCSQIIFIGLVGGVWTFIHVPPVPRLLHQLVS